MGKKKRNRPFDHLDKLQAELGLKFRLTDGFVFCYWHFGEIMDFVLLMDPEYIDINGPLNWQDKRALVKLLRLYDNTTEYRSKLRLTISPRVPLRHCLKSLDRVFDKYFDDLLFITLEESKRHETKT